ncbi:pleckstrin homology domain-containing family A member 5-like [Micropterus dolomieu]|uniref:pleckstrin homology domain-containing family A member 5-like n=1 Tax=Micropterus dolomieu TaxID=147949 RepID=UPI001E8EA1F1|nr:pleckstrin homology domain-containing family A member 5-like [Micropterus dolomieu]
MAADLQPEWVSCLPSSWSYGVTRDGRVFFINEEAKSTTWLHPVSGEAVITGHRKTPAAFSKNLKSLQTAEHLH